MRKTSFYFLLTTILFFTLSCQAETPKKTDKQKPKKPLTTKTTTVRIPIAGNTYLTTKTNDKVENNGIDKWSDSKSVISTWLKINKEEKIGLSLKVSHPNSSKIKLSIDQKSVEFDLSLASTTEQFIDSFSLKPGYVRIDIQGLSKAGDQFPKIEEIILSGIAKNTQLHYVHDFETYWGRRGPSVHMAYKLPENEDIEYFYNEVTVPENNDVVGSYYMACGYGEGYFGMQVNSDDERRVLFSVWSPYKTDNPQDIPEEDRVKMTRKGKNVTVKDFGNEGSGGQSFLIYNWKAGSTYRFLTQVKPDAEGNTIYTGYFFAPEENKWSLICSFKRPKTNTWYKRAHSFLENFIPGQGWITRKVLFDNQWARTKEGKWLELSQGTFTYDTTAAKGVRQDYLGGTEKGKFFLQNCGFFNQNSKANSTFHRKKRDTKPQIDIDSLEKL